MNVRITVYVLEDSEKIGTFTEEFQVEIIRR